MAREGAAAVIYPQPNGRRNGGTDTPEGRISHDEAVDRLEGRPLRGARDGVLQRWRLTSRRSSIGIPPCATTAPYAARSGCGVRVVTVKRILCAWLLVLTAYLGSARAQEWYLLPSSLLPKQDRGTTTNYCSIVDRDLMLFGLSGPTGCALGTGHMLGISKDKLSLSGLFGLEIQLGMGSKEVSIQRERENKPISMMLKFNRHNVLLGLKFRW